jgi:hypothetical protein
MHAYIYIYIYIYTCISTYIHKHRPFDIAALERHLQSLSALKSRDAPSSEESSTAEADDGRDADDDSDRQTKVSDREPKDTSHEDKSSAAHVMNGGTRGSPAAGPDVSRSQETTQAPRSPYTPAQRGGWNGARGRGAYGRTPADSHGGQRGGHMGARGGQGGRGGLALRGRGGRLVHMPGSYTRIDAGDESLQQFMHTYGYTKHVRHEVMARVHAHVRVAYGWHA